MSDDIELLECVHRVDRVMYGVFTPELVTALMAGQPADLIAAAMAEHSRPPVLKSGDKPGKPPRTARKPRKPTLVSVAKQASKAGIEVARYEVEPDGRINVVTGKPEASTESNPWLDDLKVTKQ